MNLELLPALAAFALVSSITPGPNNLMLMASGANFGFRRSIPHMLGIGIGFCLMVLLVGAGLVQVFDSYPISHVILKICSVLYLLFLAWKIANAAPPKDADAAAHRDSDTATPSRDGPTDQGWAKIKSCFDLI